MMKTTFLFAIVLSMGYIGAEKKTKNSPFYWKRKHYVMPWLKGPNVCAVEEVTGSRKRYYSECMTYMPRQICHKPTFIRYHCCSGFEKSADHSRGCQAVAPIVNLSEIIKKLYLREFRKYCKTVGLDELLRNNGTYTVFVPHNRAFRNLTQRTKSKLSTKFHNKNLLTYHMVEDRHFLKDLVDQVQLKTIHEDNPHIRVNRYVNGIVTVNCARLIIPNQMASNGLVHVIEKVIEPIEKGNLMDVLITDNRFGELVTAMIVTQIGNLLRDGKRKFTIFAPTDAAFRNAPQAVVDRILNDKDILEKLLKYHFIEQDICSAAVLGDSKLRTLEGQKVNLSCGVDDLFYVNNISVSQADILAQNGIIHVIDDILIPDSAKSLYEILLEQEHYEFLEYAQQAGLAGLLKGEEDIPQNYTVFVPSVEVLANMSRPHRRNMQSSAKRVKKVIGYHLAPGRITTRNIHGRHTAKSHTDREIKLRLDVINEGFSVNGAKIESSNHEGSNGVVHVINRVLLPPEKNAHSKLREDSTLSTFRALVETADMDVLLRDANANITVFAPDNEAFDVMDSNIIERLVLNEDELKEFLSYHIVDQPVYTYLLKPKLTYRYETRLDDEWVYIRQREKGAPFIINKTCKTLSEPLEVTNGVIYKIDKSLDCPCLKSNDIFLR